MWGQGVTNQDSSLLNQQKLIGSQTNNSGKALWQGGQARKSSSFPCLLVPNWRLRAGSLYGMRIGVCPGVGPEGWLKWSAHPSSCSQPPAFVSALQKWQ